MNVDLVFKELSLKSSRKILQLLSEEPLTVRQIRSKTKTLRNQDLSREDWLRQDYGINLKMGKSKYLTEVNLMNEGMMLDDYSWWINYVRSNGCGVHHLYYGI